MEKKREIQKTFFSEETRLNKLKKKGNPLIKLEKEINWEIFKDILEKMFNKEKKDKRGRPHYNYIMMFKILILQTMYQLSDDQTEYQIMDKRSFETFLDLSVEDTIPDSKTIWHFRNELSKQGKIQDLFNRFNEELKRQNLLISEGIIVDASIIESERPINTKEENKYIKEKKEYPKGWTERKKSQKDIEARWTKKRNINYIGYKNNVKIDQEKKFIIRNEITPANIHDSQVLEKLLDEEDKNKKLWGDSAYNSEKIRKKLEELNITDKINSRAYRNKPLSNEEKEKNNRLSKVRARVEHVFGYMKYNLSMRKIRSIGLKRATTIIGLMNLTYNMNRFILYKRRGLI